MKPDDELFIWCKQVGISKFYEALKEHIESPLDFIELTSTEIDDLCKDIQIKFGFKNKFKKAIKGIQSENDEKEEKEKTKDELKKKPKIIRNLPPGFSVVPHKSLIVNERLKTRFSGTDNNKTIMMIGEPASGRKTLINSMMNYIYDVQLDDVYRFKLIERTKATDLVTVYQIEQPEYGNISYGLTIIDTPSFGWTPGIQNIDDIIKKISYCIENNLDSINGFCFIMKGTNSRINHMTKCIFNKVLNLFAKDISENIFVLVTFSGGQKPPVMDALKQGYPILSRCQIFKFDNSAYQQDPTNRDSDDDDSLYEIFWNMGSKCYANFFKSLNKTQAKSLHASCEVIKQRKVIEATIKPISNSIDRAIATQQNIADQQRYIARHKQAIDFNKEVWHNEERRQWAKIPSSCKTNTTCFSCGNKTCHKGCRKPDKYRCDVMNSDNVCNACGCHANKHRNTDYYYEMQTVTKRVSNWDHYHSKKDQFEADKLGLSKVQMLLKSLTNEQKRLQEEINRMIHEILKYKNLLESVALRPTLTTVSDNYIDEAMQNESDSPNRDIKKIRQLKQYKIKEKLLENIIQSTKMEDLLQLK